MRVVQEPLELAQEYRKFDLKNPWEVFPKFRDQDQGLDIIRQQHHQKGEGSTVHLW